jgi:hypothetical protein
MRSRSSIPGRVAPVLLAAIQDDLDLLVPREGLSKMQEEIGLISRNQKASIKDRPCRAAAHIDRIFPDC